MIESMPQRLLFTAAFLFCAVWCVRELVIGRTWFDRVAHGLHLLMAIAMATMLWPAAMNSIPLAPQVAVFAAATVWFVGSMVWAQRRRAKGLSEHGGMHYLPHAVMMGAMAWHLQAMAFVHAAGGHGHSGAGHEAAGHEASGHGGHAGHGEMAGHGDMAASTPWWDTLWMVGGWVLFGALALWGVSAAVRAIQAKRSSHSCSPGGDGAAALRLGHASEAIMCLGMFAVTLPLLGVSLG